MTDEIRRQAKIVRHMLEADEKLTQTLDALDDDNPRLMEERRIHRIHLGIQTAMLAKLVIKFLEKDGQL